MSIIMRATLHDHAPNTYYGQWPAGKAAASGPRTPAIAHDALAASARIVAFHASERDFPINRSPPRWKFVSRPKRKICAPDGAHDPSVADRVFHAKREILT